MLELRPSCEHCDKSLPPDSTEAMICTFECTFCSDCVNQLLHNVCPNCGGGFERRPIRPNAHLTKRPPSDQKVFKPIDFDSFKVKMKTLKDIPPHKR